MLTLKVRIVLSVAAIRERPYKDGTCCKHSNWGTNVLGR